MNITRTKKKVFKKPIIEVIKVKNDQIIVTSGPDGNSFGTRYNGYKLF